jgi:hypothetical protein
MGDMRVFRLFHISVFWRASISREFHGFDLGPYAERMRHILLSGDPGPLENFPVFGRVLVGDGDEVVQGLVTTPLVVKWEHSHVYTMCYAGCEWFLVVTDHPTSKIADLARKFCRPEALTLFVSHYLDARSSNFLFSEVRRTGHA